MNILNITPEVTELVNNWRWRSEASVEEQTVENPQHIAVLVNAMDSENSWVAFEQDDNETLTFVQILYTPEGYLVEVNDQTNWVSRVTRESTDSIESLPGHSISPAEELFASDETLQIILTWMTTRTIPTVYRLRELLPTGTPLVKKVKSKRR